MDNMASRMPSTVPGQMHHHRIACPEGVQARPDAQFRQANGAEHSVQLRAEIDIGSNFSEGVYHQRQRSIPNRFRGRAFHRLDIGFLDENDPARTDQGQHVVENSRAVRNDAQREPRVNQIEGSLGKPGREGIRLLESDVSQSVGARPITGHGEFGGIHIGPDHRPIGSDPAAQ